ncbi:hypothetical protein J0H58_29215 [bacterium]|nr:hypothetical protein [bacterium]
MNAVLYLFGGGGAFFVGVALVLAGIAIFAVQRSRVVATLLAVVGLILIAFSAIPLPYWLYGLAGGVSVLWLAAERSGGRLRSRRGWLRDAGAGIWLAAVAVELPHHILPAVPPTGDRPTLHVIGDSLAAGTGSKQEETWPRRLARVHGIEVVDLSRVGATTISALGQAEKLPADGGVVLIEIGGNDLLGPTSAADFDRDLGELLARVCRPGRAVLMVELPLPPPCNGFGLAQRRRAAEHGVALIPRRVLMGVLTADDTTTDGLHLTPAGHGRMADALWDAIRPAYGH